MPDLTTTYLGLTLQNPLVVSASPLSKRIDRVRQLEEAGAAAVVTFSIFEEQIAHESRELDFYLERGTHSYAEAMSYFPDLNNYNLGLEAYLEHIQRLKQAVAIPIIGSLNGVSPGGWIDYARMIEQAGADAIELNIYDIATDPDVESAQLEAGFVHLVRDVATRVTIPVAVKLSPFFTALPNIARRFADAGARGLVLFNRFYQPDFDLEQLEVTPNLVLSTSDELRLPLRWIAILHGHIDVDFALTSGVHSAQDVLKAMMAGARVTMLASALIAHGPVRIGEILAELQTWMIEREYESIAQMQGSMSRRAVAAPDAFERANYMKALSTYDRRLA